MTTVLYTPASFTQGTEIPRLAFRRWGSKTPPLRRTQDEGTEVPVSRFDVREGVATLTVVGWSSPG
jgi:hypothetical protein